MRQRGGRWGAGETKREVPLCSPSIRDTPNAFHTHIHAPLKRLLAHGRGGAEGGEAVWS